MGEITLVYSIGMCPFCFLCTPRVIDAGNSVGPTRLFDQRELKKIGSKMAWGCFDLFSRCNSASGDNSSLSSSNGKFDLEIPRGMPCTPFRLPLVSYVFIDVTTSS